MPSAPPSGRVLPDYTVESIDETWLRFGSGAPRHLMLDPGHCIACGDCEAACPWECLYALPESDTEQDGAVEFFMFEDAKCARCGICVEVCPTHSLYFARLSEGTGATRTLGVVPLGKGAAVQ